MKSGILGLRTIIYKVASMEDGKAWYNQIFQTTPYFDEPFFVGYDIGGYELGLQPRESTATEFGDQVIAYWGVNNLEPEFNRILQLGAEIYEKPTNVGGGIQVAAVKDPWGNIIGLIYNPEFKLPDAS